MNQIEEREIVSQAIGHLMKAKDCLAQIGINNMTQQGVIKECIMAWVMRHKLMPKKHGADACDIDDPTVLYEYLSAQNKSPFAMDDMNSRPLEMKEASLLKLTRNKNVYCGMFINGIEIQEIWQVDPKTLADHTSENLTKRDRNGQNKNNQHTINYSQKLIRSIGVRVYPE